LSVMPFQIGLSRSAAIADFDLRRRKGPSWVFAAGI
jgi:hypothetical protein